MMRAERGPFQGRFDEPVPPRSTSGAIFRKRGERESARVGKTNLNGGFPTALQGDDVVSVAMTKAQSHLLETLDDGGVSRGAGEKKTSENITRGGSAPYAHPSVNSWGLGEAGAMGTTGTCCWGAIG